MTEPSRIDGMATALAQSSVDLDDAEAVTFLLLEAGYDPAEAAMHGDRAAELAMGMRHVNRVCAGLAGDSLNG